MEQLSGGLLSCHPVNKTISTKTIFDCLRFTMNFHDDRDKTEHIQTPQKLNINKTSTNRTMRQPITNQFSNLMNQNFGSAQNNVMITSKSKNLNKKLK